MPKTSKAERLRFDREVRKMLVEEFGAISLGMAMYQYRLHTKAGPLNVSVHVGHDAPGNVMTRFDYAVIGKSIAGATWPSGKWNHHFSSGTGCDEALECVRRHLEHIRPTSLEEFTAKTKIDVVKLAAGIIAGRGPDIQRYMTDPTYMHNQGYLDFDAAVAWFTRHCEQQLVALYDMNQRINAMLCIRSSALGVATSHIECWLDRYLDNPPRYRKEHPDRSDAVKCAEVQS